MTGSPTDWNAMGRGAALVAAGAIIGAAGVATASAMTRTTSPSSSQAAGGLGQLPGGPGTQQDQQGQSNGLAPQGGTPNGTGTQNGTGSTGQSQGVLPPGFSDGSSGSGTTGAMPQGPQRGGGGPMVSSGGS